MWNDRPEFMDPKYTEIKNGEIYIKDNAPQHIKEEMERYKKSKAMKKPPKKRG